MARSRNSAVAVLDDDCFDFIILDLKLPPSDGGLDLDVEHGRFVFESTQELAGGTPVLILTGSPAESFINGFLARSTRVDIWGDGAMMPTVSFLTKGDVDRLSAVLGPAVESLRAVKDVEVKISGPTFTLTWEQDRLVRIFVRRRGGVSCTLFKISGGLSGADVFRVTVADVQGVQILNSIMKIGLPEMVAGEAAKYDRFASRLPEGATARMIEDVRFGGCRSAAITYRLADSFTRNIFDLVRSDSGAMESVIATVSDLIRPWRAGVPQTRVTISEVRRRIFSDEKLAQVCDAYELRWVPALERRPVQARWCCIHGDLHGANILVDDQNAPILIDYGDMGEGPAALDWVTLELSLLFHPQGPARAGPWPTPDDCFAWADTAAYCSASPVASLVQACRRACEECCAGPRENAAAAYAYIIRQLSYDDTDKTRALALLEGVRNFIETGT